MTLNHVHIGTIDISRSQKFYESIFGFKKKLDHGAGVFLQNNAGFLIAIDPVDALPTFPSWYHLGFCLDSENEVLSMHNRCKDLDVKIARDQMHEKDQFASFFILDPDSYKIEVSWHRE
jgi:catechol 2,3-dioxygenase-like lactoylglutathione lyase family enzyme